MNGLASRHNCSLRIMATVGKRMSRDFGPQAEEPFLPDQENIKSHMALNLPHVHGMDHRIDRTSPLYAACQEPLCLTSLPPAGFCAIQP